MEKMKDTVLEILQDIQPDYDFTQPVDFVASGYLDSFDVVSLVAALEEKFGISISALEILPENFASLEKICQLVQKSGAR